MPQRGAVSLSGDAGVGDVESGKTFYNTDPNVRETGTLVVADDAFDTDDPTGVVTSASTGRLLSVAIAGGADLIICTITDTYDSLSKSIGFAYCQVLASTMNTLKMQLYMDGVQMGESGFILNYAQPLSLNSTKAMSGSKTSQIKIHNYDAGSVDLRCHTDLVSAGSRFPSVVLFVGSLKI